MLMATGCGVLCSGEMRSDVFGDCAVFLMDLEKDGGGPLDAPERLSAGASYRAEHWRGLVGSAWSHPVGCSRFVWGAE